MPATNPRLTITLQPSVAAVLRRLSELTGNSQSSIVGDLLHESLSTFERMAVVLDAAVALKAQALEVPSEIRASLQQAQGRLEQQLGLIIDGTDQTVLPLLDDMEEVLRRAAGDARRTERAPAARRAAAPISNRGVTPRENPRTDVRKAEKQVTRSASSSKGTKGVKTRKGNA